MAEGTPADATRVVDISTVKGGQPAAIRKMLGPLADGLREQGYKWFRITAPADDEDHVYMQAWRIRPEVEGALDRGAATVGAPTDG